MAILLRICLTPIAFMLVARAQARFGDRVGGRLIGLPLTTGPFLLAVTLTSSRVTAAHAAAGVTAGQMAVVVFCAAYAWMALQLPPLRATLTALAIALTSVVALSTVSGAWPAAIAVWLVIAAALVRWPWPQADARAHAPADVGPAATPAAGPKPKAPMLQNALIATVVVATMTTLVPILGAHLAGIITSAPIILSFLLPGTHRARGGAGAAAVARGTIISMAAIVAFSTVLATGLERFAAGPALLIAAVVLGALVAATATVTRAAARGRAPARP